MHSVCCRQVLWHAGRTRRILVFDVSIEFHFTCRELITHKMQLQQCRLPGSGRLCGLLW